MSSSGHSQSRCSDSHGSQGWGEQWLEQLHGQKPSSALWHLREGSGQQMWAGWGGGQGPSLGEADAPRDTAVSLVPIVVLRTRILGPAAARPFLKGQVARGLHPGYVTLHEYWTWVLSIPPGV